eukprot:754457-Hanusia_phi.AAC.4
MLNRESSDIKVLVWGEHGNSEQRDILFRPKTTWNTGRNELLQEAMYDERRRNQTYKYYIFMDGDVSLKESSEWGENTGDPYSTFEKYLLLWEPAVGFPGFFKDPPEIAQKEVATTYNFDAIVNAIHRQADAVWLLLPYDTHWEHRSWWYSQYFSTSTGEKGGVCEGYRPHHHDRLQFNAIRAYNKETGSYSQRDNEWERVLVWMLSSLRCDVDLLAIPLEANNHIPSLPQPVHYLHPNATVGSSLLVDADNLRKGRFRNPCCTQERRLIIFAPVF